ncbi:dihydrofolate reductase [Cellulomonas sp. DKR-3]|uniref:Dihydrofolate reductase n=1 Tax=Cellulomonas fulva TaxID=2835530 RepID=A0ABS5U336_9CELL|nr:dihydrofolate reductase [Cellulomonas fulva]MBT0995767.1 dihydrofolate reductase [Cellulomonas fulva]
MTTGRTVVGLVWGQTPRGVIGRDNAMPWHVPEDLARFKQLTSGHPVVMGRATWESLPERSRPLPGRTNVVLSRTPGLELAGALVVPDLPTALAAAAAAPGGDEVWVMGGGAVYAQALEVADRAEVTVIDLDVAGDTYAPHLPPDRWRLVDADPAGGWRQSARGPRYRFQSYRRTDVPRAGTAG